MVVEEVDSTHTTPPPNVGKSEGARKSRPVGRRRWLEPEKTQRLANMGDFIRLYMHMCKWYTPCKWEIYISGDALI